MSHTPSDSAIESLPVWSPDGSRIVFSSRPRGLYDIYVKLFVGGEKEELFFASPENKNTYDWSSDGRYILFSKQSATPGVDIWALPLEQGRPQKEFPVVQTGANENLGRFSPDGRWVAYSSNETGRSEIYVQPFPDPGVRTQISNNGGNSPQWGPNGREIFYQSPDNQFMAAPITLFSDGQPPDSGTPVRLFALRPGSLHGGSPDGQRFLFNIPLQDDTTPPITVILNWKPPTP